MRTEMMGVVLAALAGAAACGSSDSDSGAMAGSSGKPNGGAAGKQSAGTAGTSSAGSSAATAGTSGKMAAMAGTPAAGTTAGAGGAAGSSSTAGNSGAMPSFDEAKGWIDDYMAAHPGQAGDINAKSPAEIAADPAAQRLLSLCGAEQRPVIPALAWEFGGSDHAWIDYEASALLYCIYIPVSPDSDNWQYDAAADHVTADLYVRYPDRNPCKDEQGADQVIRCIGDPTNFEILVDTASLNDGAGAGLELSEASTELKLILPDQTKIHLFDGD